MMLRSLPSFTTRALPNGIVKSGPGFSERLYGCRYRCLCSRNITGSSERIAVRNNPATSSAVEGITTRNPGQCVKIDSPLWLIHAAAGQVTSDGHAQHHG